MNIITHNTIIYLKNIRASPYWNTFIESGIGYDKDDEGNIIFDEGFDLDHIKCYIDYCNSGYISTNTFNVELFEYMGHDCTWKLYQDYLRLRLQHQWKQEYNPKGFIPYEKIYLKCFNEISDELVEDMDKLFDIGGYIVEGSIPNYHHKYNIIVFCTKNEGDSDTLFYNGVTYTLKYANGLPLDYIKNEKLDGCYYNGIYYYDTNLKDTIKHFNKYYLDNLNIYDDIIFDRNRVIILDYRQLCLDNYK